MIVPASYPSAAASALHAARAFLSTPRSAGFAAAPSEPLESPGLANLAGVPPELVVAGVLGPGVCVPSSVSCLESVR